MLVDVKEENHYQRKKLPYKKSLLIKNYMSSKADYLISQPGYTLLFFKDDQKLFFIIPSKKNIRLAQQRNLFKRIFKEQIRMFSFLLVDYSLIVLSKKSPYKIDRLLLHQSILLTIKKWIYYHNE